MRSLNPWLSIWLRPRETIRDIVETRIAYRVHMLAVLYGVELVLNRSIRKHVGDMMPWSWIWIGAMVLGPLVGLVLLYVGSFAFRWVGRKLGGNATFAEVRAAYAWSFLPGIVSFVFFAPYFLLFRWESFTSETPQLDALLSQSEALSLLMMVVGTGIVISSLVLGVWQMVILSKTLGEVHGFSAWRGLWTWLIPGLAFLAVLFAILVLQQAIYVGP